MASRSSKEGHSNAGFDDPFGEERGKHVTKESEAYNGSTFKKPFRKTAGCKAMVSIIVIVVVVVVVVPTSVCLTGHCGGKKKSCDWDCSDLSVHWSYDVERTGPSCWKECFDACGRHSQSPINLVPADAKPTPPGDELILKNYEVTQNITLFNNGHTVQGDLSLQTNISGIGLPGVYLGQQFHFHWGRTSETGSEHLVGGKQFPMEIHLVHYSARFDNFGDAADQPEGLAVLGILFEVVPEDNEKYATLLANLEHVKYKDDTTMFEMRPGDLIGTATDNSFYRYPGSLTTPPCHESIVWTVFTTAVQISEKQLDKFRNLFHGDADSHHLYDNYRPVLPLAGRQLQFTDIDHEAHTTHAQLPPATTMQPGSTHAQTTTIASDSTPTSQPTEGGGNSQAQTTNTQSTQAVETTGAHTSGGGTVIATTT